MSNLQGKKKRVSAQSPQVAGLQLPACSSWARQSMRQEEVWNIGHVRLVREEEVGYIGHVGLHVMQEEAVDIGHVKPGMGRVTG